jgi:hypothetical protein
VIKLRATLGRKGLIAWAASDRHGVLLLPLLVGDINNMA